ncbi:hypothetical protein [Neisseria yangbaofengii]|uniref:hypothetical protein n=1 Tax=Neisseria yangbaofengii TaxID=2709396 RepID=UPI001980FBA4|nr:hypothetical protein [Neisseria yangbaofengii]
MDIRKLHLLKLEGCPTFGVQFNIFDKERVQSEIDLQRKVSQEFGKNTAQGVARLSDYLGNTRDFQRAEILKSAIESELASTQDAGRRETLQQALSQTESYLEANRGSYETWKEGGVGRSILHAGVGGLMTGNASGALAGGATSLAAPYLNAAEDKFGTVGGTLLNTVGGAAVGYAVGGNVGAATVGANVDWHNRQLHPQERKWITDNAKAFAKQENGGREPTANEIALAEKRLAQQAAKDTDLLWMVTLDKVTDLSAQNFLRQAKETFENENNKPQRFFTTHGKQFIRPELFANEINDLSFYKNNLHSFKNSSISKGTGELARKVASSSWDKAKQDPILTGLQIAAAPVHLVLDAGKASWQCVSGFGQCLQQGKEHFVETGAAIGTGVASVTLNDLQPIYGQSIRGAQTGLVALQTADGITTAFGAAKALNVVGKGSRYFVNEWVSSPPIVNQPNFLYKPVNQ